MPNIQAMEVESVDNRFHSVQGQQIGKPPYAIHQYGAAQHLFCKRIKNLEEHYS